MRSGIGFLLLTLAFAAAAPVGWWTVPLTGALWGVLGSKLPRPALLAGLAAGTAWGLWLIYDASVAGKAFGPFLERVAGVFTIPAAVLVIVTLLFPGFLAWSAAALAGGRGRC
jgi:hypothetical protein